MHRVGTLDGIDGDCSYQSHGSIVAVDVLCVVQSVHCLDHLNNSSEPGSAEPEVAAGLATEAAWPAPKAAARLAICSLSVYSKHEDPRSAQDKCP